MISIEIYQSTEFVTKIKIVYDTSIISLQDQQADNSFY